MNALKFLTFFWVLLITLTSCEQEELLHRSTSAPIDPDTDLAATSKGSPSRNFEVLDLTKVVLDRNGYQRVRQNKTSGSVVYAYVKKGKIASFQIRKSNGRKVNFVAPGHGGNCPDIYVCIHPVTGKYIYYDKCVTDNPCRQICPDLWWCIDPVTGNYILYDKCKTDTSPCEQDTPPLIIVSKKYKILPFCPTVDYTWMIDPVTGEYVLYSECDSPSQLFLEVGW